jgi:septal ring factor EnvC (AmiA/AmiB activator)
VRAGALAAGLLAIAAAAASAPRAPEAPSPASPEPFAGDERLRRIRARKEALAADLAKLRGQEKTLLGQVERLELEVRLRGEQLRETQAVLQRTNEQIESSGRRVRELEATLAAERPALAARARALYKLGELSYFRLLLSVERPADAIRGYRFVSGLARRDKERIAGFRRDLAALDATRAELATRAREAAALRADLARARAALDADRAKKTELLTSLVERKEVNAAYLQELEEAEGRLARLLAGAAGGDVSLPIAAFRGTLRWPVAGPVRTGFGRHKHPRFDTYTVHNGIDIAAVADTPVGAVHEGTVVFADQFRGYGLMVVVDHGDKHHTLYAHLGEARVAPGRHVAAGEIVGTVGSSGLEGPGLYFEFRREGRPQDPLEWLDGR